MPNRDRPAFLAFSSDGHLTVSTMWQKHDRKRCKEGQIYIFASVPAFAWLASDLKGLFRQGRAPGQMSCISPCCKPAYPALPESVEMPKVLLDRDAFVAL